MCDPTLKNSCSASASWITRRCCQLVVPAHPVLAFNNKEGLLVPDVEMVTDAGLTGRVAAPETA